MQQSPPAALTALDRPSAILAGAYLGGLNMLVVNLQPLILGAFADAYGFTDRQLGHIGAVFVGFATICSLTGPLWVRRVDWRSFSRIAIAAAVVVLLAGAYLNSASFVFAVFAILGAIKAGLGIPAFASLGDGSNPDRNYGISVGFQGLLAALVTAPSAAYILPRFGVQGLFVTIAILVATGLLVCRWLPRRGIEKQDAIQLQATSGASPLPALVALLALALFTASILGFWYFIERIGMDRGVPATLIGLSLSAISIASILTASLVAWLGGRLHSLAFIGGGSALLIAGFAAMRISGDGAYVAGTMAFAMGWGLAQPAYYAVVRKVDLTGRLFVAAPAAGGVAGVAVGVVAGPIIEGAGYLGLTYFCSALAFIAGFVALIAIGISASASSKHRAPIPRVPSRGGRT